MATDLVLDRSERTLRDDLPIAKIAELLKQLDTAFQSLSGINNNVKIDPNLLSREWEFHDQKSGQTIHRFDQSQFYYVDPTLIEFDPQKAAELADKLSLKDVHHILLTISAELGNHEELQKISRAASDQVQSELFQLVRESENYRDGDQQNLRNRIGKLGYIVSLFKHTEETVAEEKTTLTTEQNKADEKTSFVPLPKSEPKQPADKNKNEKESDQNDEDFSLDLFTNANQSYAKVAFGLQNALLPALFELHLRDDGGRQIFLFDDIERYIGPQDLQALRDHFSRHLNKKLRTLTPNQLELLKAGKLSNFLVSLSQEVLPELRQDVVFTTRLQQAIRDAGRYMPGRGKELEELIARNSGQINQNLQDATFAINDKTNRELTQDILNLHETYGALQGSSGADFARMLSSAGITDPETQDAVLHFLDTFLNGFVAPEAIENIPDAEFSGYLQRYFGVNIGLDQASQLRRAFAEYIRIQSVQLANSAQIDSLSSFYVSPEGSDLDGLQADEWESRLQYSQLLQTAGISGQDAAIAMHLTSVQIEQRYAPDPALQQQLLSLHSMQQQAFSGDLLGAAQNYPLAGYDVPFMMARGGTFENDVWTGAGNRTGSPFGSSLKAIRNNGLSQVGFETTGRLATKAATHAFLNTFGNTLAPGVGTAISVGSQMLPKGLQKRIGEAAIVGAGVGVATSPFGIGAFLASQLGSLPLLGSIVGGAGGLLGGIAAAPALGPFAPVAGALTGGTGGGLLGQVAKSALSSGGGKGGLGLNLPNFLGGGSGAGGTAGATAPAAGGLSLTAITATPVAQFGTGMLLGSSVMFMSSTSGAFLPPLPTVGLDGEQSRYVLMQKSASPVEKGKLPEPRDLSYKITIKPRAGYKIQITGIEDKFSISANKEERAKDGLSPEAPAAPTSPITLDTLKAKDADLTLSYVSPENIEGIELDPYQTHFDASYQHTNVKNTVTLKFNVLNADGSQVFEGGVPVTGEQTAITAEVVCFGECPQAQNGCWPVSGVISQFPYNPGNSHALLDAFDLGSNSPKAPPKFNIKGRPVYATFPGTACAKYMAGGKSTAPDGSIKTWGGYGNYIQFEAEPSDGPPFTLIFGHLDAFADDISMGECVPIDESEVGEGRIIGYVGDTGNSTAAHLHYEYRPGAGNFSGSMIRKITPDGQNVQIGDFVRSCYETADTPGPLP